MIKARLPQLRYLTTQLQADKETCEEKMKSIMASAYLYLGLLAKRDNDMEKAMHYTRLSLRVDPEFHLAYYNLGVMHQDAGNIEGMFECFRNATEISPSDGQSWSALGDAFFRKGMGDEARSAYEIAKSLIE